MSEREKEKTRKRESGFELLRILAMMMIVGNHLINHGILKVMSAAPNQLWLEGSRVNRLVCAMLSSGGRVGVAVFFMISGYFLSGRTKMSLSSLKKILIEVHYFGVVMAAFFLLITKIQYGDLTSVENIPRILIKFLFVPADLWWFALVYIVLLFLAPSLNVLVGSFRYRWVLPALILFLWHFFYTAGDEYTYFNFARAILFYLAGVWIRAEFGELDRGSVRKTVLLGAVCLGFWLFSGWLSWIKLVSATGGTHAFEKILFWPAGTFLNDIVIPLHAAALMLLFRQVRFSSDLVNRIAGYTFGVYLFHECPYTKAYMWGKMLRADTFQYRSRWFPLLAVADVLIIFAAGIVLGIIRGGLGSLISRITSKD